MQVTLGKETKPARFVAMRTKSEIAEKNLLEVKENARKKIHTLTAAQKERYRW